MIGLRLFRRNRIILRRAQLHPLLVNRQIRRRLDLVVEILLKGLQDDERHARTRHVVLAAAREILRIARRPHGRQHRPFRHRLLQRRHLGRRKLLDRHRVFRRIQLVGEDETLLADTGRQRRVQLGRTIIDDRINRRQERGLLGKETRRIRHVRIGDQLPSALLGELRRETRTVRRDLALTGE